MKNLKIIITLCLFITIISCQQEKRCVDESKINPEAACTMEWKPVCGCDNKTYGNECQATNAGLLSWTDGECPE